LSSWSSLLNAISIQLPSLLFGAYFSSTIVGYYALGYNAINLPMVMLRDSIAQVFFPIAAREYQELGSVTHVIKTFFLRLVQIGVFPVVIVSVWGSTLFKVVFGPRWVEAGIYAQILAVWSFFGFLNAPLRVFEIVHRQEIDLFINILLLTSRTIGLWLGLIFTSPKVALGIFVVISVGILGGSVVVKLRLAHVPIFWAIKILIQYLLLACVLIFPVQLIAWSVNDSRIVLGALGLATVGYGLALFMIDHSFREFVFTILSRVGINR
jgi:lipopolysaccharide exporter